MARCAAPQNLEEFFSIRVGNIPEDVTSERILEDFSAFGPVADFYRPVILGKKKPSRYAFLRYSKKEDADQASFAMHGSMYAGNRLTVNDANLQDSYFTQDTGFITNQLFDTPKVIVNDFDGSLPSNHYAMKRKEELKNIDTQYAIRIDDLPTHISKEDLEAIFSEFGEVTSVYLPLDLKTMKPKGFAFVRYAHEQTAHIAAKSMDNAFLGEGRNIQVTVSKNRSYYSQDESCMTEYASCV